MIALILLDLLDLLILLTHSPPRLLTRLSAHILSRLQTYLVIPSCAQSSRAPASHDHFHILLRFEFSLVCMFTLISPSPSPSEGVVFARGERLRGRMERYLGAM